MTRLSTCVIEKVDYGVASLMADRCLFCLATLVPGPGFEPGYEPGSTPGSEPGSKPGSVSAPATGFESGPATSLLCDPCRRGLHLNRCPCEGCGEPLPEHRWRRRAGERLCGRCLVDPFSFEAVRAPLVYRDETRRLVQRFKAEAHLPSAQLLVALFLEASPAGEKEGVPDALIGVPRHPARAKRFGFDQGQWLADELGRRLGVPVRRAWRRRDDRPQHELGSRARRRIASGMFGIASGLPRHVALVDDVMTTGATLERLAQACRRAGARRVDAWALARTPPPWLC